MRILPNLLSVIRLCCCLLMVLLIDTIPLLLAVYICAGISDVLDGFLARRWHVTSSLGATLDSIGDTAFTLTTMYIVMRMMHWPQWLIIWIIAICVIKSITAILGWYKYHSLAFLHTTLNKLAGIIVFVTPVLLLITNEVILTLVPCAVATLASLEELYITVLSPTLSPNIQSSHSLSRGEVNATSQPTETTSGVYSADITDRRQLNTSDLQRSSTTNHSETEIHDNV